MARRSHGWLLGVVALVFAATGQTAALALTGQGTGSQDSTVAGLVRIVEPFGPGAADTARPAAGLTVKLIDGPGAPPVATTTTAADGAYALAKLAPSTGAYVEVFDHAGAELGVSGSLEIRGGSTSKVDLDVVPADLSRTIAISGTVAPPHRSGSSKLEVVAHAYNGDAPGAAVLGTSSVSGSKPGAYLVVLHLTGKPTHGLFFRVWLEENGTLVDSVHAITHTAHPVEVVPRLQTVYPIPAVGASGITGLTVSGRVSMLAAFGPGAADPTKPASGLTVKLLNGGITPIATTTTGAAGLFELTNLSVSTDSARLFVYNASGAELGQSGAFAVNGGRTASTRM